MKKSILCLFVVLFTLSLSAQQKGKIRVGFDAGLGFPNKGLGFGGDLDFRYNIMDNLNVGVKYSGAVLLKDFYVDKFAGTASITSAGITSFLATSDYYFNKGTTMFAPFLGGGLGLYSVMNIGVTSSGTTTPTVPTDLSAFKPLNTFGGLIRGGFESGHFRMGLEYYLVPKTNVIDLSTMTPSGITNNSYLNFFLGFYFGGGHWKKYNN